MGRICFQTSRIQFLDEPLLRSCYMTGLEGIAWEREITFAGTRLMIDRQTHESGHFFSPGDQKTVSSSCWEPRVCERAKMIIIWK